MRQSSVDRVEESVWASVCARGLRRTFVAFIASETGFAGLPQGPGLKNEFEFTRTNHSHRVDFTGTHPVVRNKKKKRKKKEDNI